MEKQEQYALIYRALADENRIQILHMLALEEKNAGELLDALNVVQSTLSHHMKVLTESGLVDARKSGKWTYYSLNEACIRDAGAFLLDMTKPADLPEIPEQASEDKRPVPVSPASGSEEKERGSKDSDKNWDKSGDTDRSPEKEKKKDRAKDLRQHLKKKDKKEKKAKKEKKDKKAKKEK